MGKVVSLSCTNCGGPVKANTTGKYQCEFCRTEIFFYGESEYYTVKAGTLEKYTGSGVEVCVPSGVSVIGKGAFAHLEALESVALPTTLKKIEDDAFLGCRELKEIHIPPSVRHIGQRAFKECGLQSVIITGELEYIGAEAFMQCENLTEVTLSCKLPSECIKTFKQCRQLSKVNMDQDLLAPSFAASMDTKKPGDHRPTYFDLFQGTPFFTEKNTQYSQKKCLYCGGKINGKNICEQCGVKYYLTAQRGCYIATCIYGSYDCPQVWVLRRYRDNTLSSTWYGRLFIRLYYAISPTLVKLYGRTEWFKKFWKKKLDRMVRKLRSNGIKDTPYEDEERSR